MAVRTKGSDLVTIHGLDTLQAHLKALRGALPVVAYEAGSRKVFAEVVVPAMQQSGAFETHTLGIGLRDSMRVRKSTKRERADSPGALHKIEMAYYWDWVNFGHGGPKPAPAHEFVETTLMATRNEQAHVFRAAVIRAAERLAQQTKSGKLSKINRRLADA